MDKTMKMQTQIRQNADEISNFMSGLGEWEKKMTKKDGKKKVKSTTSTTKTAPIAKPSVPEKSAASHTYDVGYKKWEHYKEEDDTLATTNETEPDEEAEEETGSTDVVTVVSPDVQTPATIANLPKVTKGVRAPAVNSAQRVVRTGAEAEAHMREQGNAEYSKGNFTAAIKIYTKCIGMKTKNYVAFSNRAMCHLKTKEMGRAEWDCTVALSMEPLHIKSYQRRATARNALGKHRAALVDLLECQRLTSVAGHAGGGAVRVEVNKTQEMLRSAVNRVSMMDVPIALA